MRATIAKVSVDSFSPKGKALLAQLCADAAGNDGVARAVYSRQSPTLAYVTVDIKDGHNVDDVMESLGCPMVQGRTGRPDLKRQPLAVSADG